MLRFLLQGELPEQVDAVITKFGMPMGPAMLIWPDFILVGARARTAAKSLRSRMLCEAGRFAQKTGKGCYRYEQGSRSPLPDPDVEKFITARLAKPTSIVGADVRLFGPAIIGSLAHEGHRAELKTPGRPEDAANVILK